MRGHILQFYIDQYGSPLFREKITGLTKKERMFADIPDEVAVFKIDHPSEIMVVGKLANGKWLANFGDRTVIKLLLERIDKTN